MHRHYLLSVCLHQKHLSGAIMSAGARLTELDLSDNAFGPDGVKGIEQLLKSPSCHTLRELKLNNCGMGIGGGKASAHLNSVYLSQQLPPPIAIFGFKDFSGANELTKAKDLVDNGGVCVL